MKNRRSIVSSSILELVSHKYQTGFAEDQLPRLAVLHTLQPGFSKLLSFGGSPCSVVQKSILLIDSKYDRDNLAAAPLLQHHGLCPRIAREHKGPLSFARKQVDVPTTLATLRAWIRESHFGGPVNEATRR